MKKSILTIALTAISCVVWFFIGYYQPPFKLISATQINTTDYSLELEDHHGSKFFLCIPIEKTVALEIDTNEIIILSNQ